MEAKVVLITGSSSGIGEATAHLFAKKGYKVAVHGSTSQEKVDKVVAQCNKLSPNKYEALSLVLDFSDANNGELAVKKTVDHFGRLDVLVNNAGMFNRMPLKEYEGYKKTMTINLDASVKASFAAIEHLKKSSGNIVFVSSIASIKPSLSGYAYCMSKASLSIFAKCLAQELAPNVRSNIISPGPVHTPIFERSGINIDMAAFNATTLLRRIGTSEEIAKSIHFIASDDAAFITGHELFIDGGYMINTSTMQQTILKTLQEKK